MCVRYWAMRTQKMHFKSKSNKRTKQTWNHCSWPRIIWRTLHYIMRGHLSSNEKKPLAEVSAKSSFTYSEGKAVYILKAGLSLSLAIGSLLSKTPSDGTCLGEPPGSFCNVGCCCCFTSLEVFHSFIAFRRHPSPFRELSPSFYTHFILSAQLIAEWFTTLYFNFSGLFIFTASAMVLSGLFLPMGVFYHTLIRLWLRCGQEHPIQDLSVCLPSQSCPFPLTHGLELLMFEL